MEDKDLIQSVLKNGSRKSIVKKNDFNESKEIVDVNYPRGIIVKDFSNKILAKEKHIVKNGIQKKLEIGTKWENISTEWRKDIDFNEKDFI